MIVFRLPRLLAKLAYESNQKQLSVEDLARATGYNRQSFTKLIKAPSANVTSAVIDATLQTFFAHFKKLDRYKQLSDQDLLKLLADELIEFKPDKAKKETKGRASSPTKKTRKKA